MSPKKIETLADLEDCALKRQSVYADGNRAFYLPRPAAFVINLQGRLLLNLFRSGLYVYEPKTTNRRKI